MLAHEENQYSYDLLMKELETRVQVQPDLDSIYEKLTCAIHNEIDLSLNIKACTKKQKKLLKSSKPYWNDELTTLWKIRKQNENEFLKCKSSKEIKRNKKNIFIESRKLFDKKLGFYERCIIETEV